MPVTYRVEVLHRNVARQFLRGGQGYRFMDKLRLAMHRACVKDAPSRTGTLKGAHRSHARGRNGYRTDVTIENIAGHALWVHDGTTGPIFPKTANFLLVPVAKGAKRRHRRGSVEGQSDNPWLDDACARVARTRGAIDVGG